MTTLFFYSLQNDVLFIYLFIYKTLVYSQGGTLGGLNGNTRSFVDVKRKNAPLVDFFFGLQRKK
jgi:hypothetical protein